MGDASGIKGYDRRNPELSNAPIHMKRHHQYTSIKYNPIASIALNSSKLKTRNLPALLPSKMGQA